MRNSSSNYSSNIVTNSKCLPRKVSRCVRWSNLWRIAGASWLFWTVFALIVVVGAVIARRNAATPGDYDDQSDEEAGFAVYRRCGLEGVVDAADAADEDEEDDEAPRQAARSG